MIDCVLLGAFERHNFGDMLMGLVFEHKLALNGVNVVHASILENDLTCFSGKKVYSIFDLVKAGLDPNTPVIHVGGETVPCSIYDAVVTDAPSTISPATAREATLAIINKLQVSRRLGYVTPPVEVIGDQNVRWGNRIFYGLGFTASDLSFATKNLLSADFADALLVGFRDSTSLHNARNVGINHAVLTPDIVLAISQILPRESETTDNGYVLLHLNDAYLQENKDVLREQLSEIAFRSKSSLRIAVAGLARGHDSLGSISSFANELAGRGITITVLPSSDILDICRQISQASAVISTSLHYRIVARSYGVPRISLNLHKLNCWASCNDFHFPYAVESDQLAEAFRRLIKTPRKIDDIVDDLNQIDAFMSSISSIVDSIRPSLPCQHLDDFVKLPSVPSQGLWFQAIASLLDDKRRTEELSAIYRFSVKAQVFKSLVNTFTRLVCKKTITLFSLKARL